MYFYYETKLINVKQQLNTQSNQSTTKIQL